MNVDCKRLRDAIFRGDRGDRGERGEESADLAAHLKSCPRCARVARLAAAARARLRERGAAIEPDPGFPLRVVARLPRPTEMLGWAALRVLPAALLLALALAWAGLTLPPSQDELLAAETSPDLFLAYGTLAPDSSPEAAPGIAR